MDADISWPFFLPRPALDIGECRIVPSRLVLHADRAAEDANVVCFAGQPGDENDGVILNPPRPLGGGIGDGPVAARQLDLLDGRERQWNAINTLPQKLDESLRRIGHGRRQPNGQRIDTAGIGPEIPETCLFTRPPAQRAMSGDGFLPSIDLIAHEVVSPATPKVIEIGPAGPDGRRILDHQAELVGPVQRRLCKVGRGNDRPARAEQIKLGVKSTDAPNPRADIKQHAQRRDIADALGEVVQVEAGNDPNLAGSMR